MRWVRYEAEGEVTYGILDGDQIEDVTGSPFESHARTGHRRPLDSVKLLVPFEPKTFYAANFGFGVCRFGFFSACLPRYDSLMPECWVAGRSRHPHRPGIRQYSSIHRCRETRAPPRFRPLSPDV